MKSLKTRIAVAVLCAGATLAVSMAPAFACDGAKDSQQQASTTTSTKDGK